MSKKENKQEEQEIKINKAEWTPERFEKELIHPTMHYQLPFTPESKAALLSLTREEAIQLNPAIYARWKIFQKEFNPAKKAAWTTNKKRKELKDWSRKVRELLSDRELTATMISQKKMPKWFNALDDDSGKLPTPAEVICATLMAKAMAGDVRAIQELRKMGYGDNITIDAGESFFSKGALKLEIIDTDSKTKELAKKELDSEPVEEDEEVEEQISEPIQTKEIESDNIPKELKEEFEQQEQERLKPVSNVNDHGIDRSILNKVVITKNKSRR